MATMNTVLKSALLCSALLVLGACSRQPDPAQAAKAAAEAKAEEAKKEQAKLAEQWNTLSAEIPQIVEVVTARVDLLEKKQTLPEGVDAAGFKTVREDASTMSESWRQALGAFANNNMQEAVAAAQTAKDKGSQVMQTLHMSPLS